MIKKAFVIGCVVFSAGSAFADPPSASAPQVSMTTSAPSPQPVGQPAPAESPMAALGPPAIIRLSGLGASVEDLGPAHGLEFWLAMNKNDKGTPIFQTFYTTPDGKALIAGVMFDDRGVDISALQLAASREGKRLTIDNASPSPDIAPPSTTKSPAGAQSMNTPASASPSQSTASSDSPSDTLAEQIPDSELSNLVAPLGASPAQFSQMLHTLAWFKVGAANLPNLVFVADPHCPVCHKAWSFLGPLVQDRKIDVTVILIHGLPEAESPAADVVSMLSDPNVGDAWNAGEGNTDGVPFKPPSSSAARATGLKFLQLNDNFAQEMEVAQTPTVFWEQNGQMMRGHDLGSVIVFMKAVLNGGVSS